MRTFHFRTKVPVQDQIADHSQPNHVCGTWWVLPLGVQTQWSETQTGIAAEDKSTPVIAASMVTVAEI
jgi:hypothetical protein